MVFTATTPTSAPTTTLMGPVAIAGLGALGGTAVGAAATAWFANAVLDSIGDSVSDLIKRQ